MRAIVLATGLILAGAAAHADTISYTAQVPPTGYDAYGGYGFQLLTPGFDGSLGVLQSVSVSVTGSAEEDILSAGGNLLPFAAQFNNIGTISGYGFAQTSVLSQNFGTASTFLADNSFAVNALFSTRQDLQDYAAQAVIGTTYMFYSTVIDTATGQIVPYDSDYAQFTGTVTETYTYGPATVPEPASIGVLALGLVTVTFLALRRGA